MQENGRLPDGIYPNHIEGHISEGYTVTSPVDIRVRSALQFVVYPTLSLYFSIAPWHDDPEPAVQEKQ